MRILLLWSVALLSGYSANAQPGAFSTYDAVTGRANAAIYNGPIYINPFRPDQNSHQFLLENSFFPAKLVYENQLFEVDQLKYDVHQNKVVLQSIGDYSNIAIDLILDKVDEFTLQNKYFVKLHQKDAARFPKNQFYEQIVVHPAATIYVRQYKTRKEVFRDDIISDRFSVANDYYLAIGGKIYLINSKGDAIKAFPNLKRSINDFAAANRNLQKSDRSTFMENLLRYISSQNN